MKSTRYAHYNLNYHLVWIPKYRRSVLKGEVAEHLKKAFRDIAEENDMEVISAEVEPDHVHLFVSAPPRYSPAKLVNIFKGATSRRLRNRFPDLRTGEGLWTRTYYAGTAGNVTTETVQRYIEECQ